MKISISTNTGITFEVAGDDAETVEAAVRAVARVIVREQRVTELRHRAGTKPRPTVVGSMDNHPRPAGVFTGTQALNAIQFETWKFLLDNDTETGVHLSAVARALSITDGAAGSRCSTLVKRGYASRVREGYYRAIKQSALVQLVENAVANQRAERNAVPTPRDVAEACSKSGGTQ